MFSRIFVFIFFALSSWLRASVDPKVVDVPQDLKSSQNFPQSWSVAGWNIEWFPGQSPTKATKTSEKNQVKAVKEVLLKEAPTILFACEVRSLEQLKRLGLKQVNLACTQIPRTKEEGLALPNQGLALISSVPWKKVWALDFSSLPPGPDRPYRGILGAHFEQANGTHFYLYGVHLKSNRGDYQSNRLRRERAMDYLRWDWKRLKIDPLKDRIIILGDFNTSLFLPAYVEEQTIRKLLKEGFVDAAEGLTAEQRITLPSALGSPFPPADFDQILVSNVWAEEIKKDRPWVQVVSVPESASDHRMMKMNLP